MCSCPNTLQHLLELCTGKDVGEAGLLSVARNYPDHWSWFCWWRVYIRGDNRSSCGTLDSLSKEAEPLGLRVFWIKTKVQAFCDILDATIESIPVNGEKVEFTQTFTYLGSVIRLSTSLSCIVRERQLRLYGHVGRLPAEDPAHRRLFFGFEWMVHVVRASTGFIFASGGVISEGYGHDGPACAWAIARRKPREYRRMVASA